MTLHEHRNRFEKHLSPAVDWCARHGVDPNELTIVSLVVTIASAVVFYLSGPAVLWLLPVGSALLGLGATLDSMDGLLARATDQATALGDYLDHAFDRFADVLVLLGLSFSPWVPLEFGLFAIVGTLLTSYMGTQAQAVGVGRDYGGLVGRADRIFILTWAPVLELGLQLAGISIPSQVAGLTIPYQLNLISLGIVWIALAGNITALQRFWGAYKALAEAGED